MAKDIHVHRQSVDSASLIGTSTSLRGLEGLVRQVYIKAGTNTTVFKANLTDDNSSDVLRNWGYHTGEINDLQALPVKGPVTINLTNLNQNDSFTVRVSVER